MPPCLRQWTATIGYMHWAISLENTAEWTRQNTHMGAKLFTNMAFDTALCAAPCSAQSAYSLRNLPKNAPAQTCRFYSTYAMYMNDVYHGQYCYIAYNATNPGQCTQPAPTTISSTSSTISTTSTPAPTRTPLDLTATQVDEMGAAERLRFTREKNLMKFAVEGFSPGVSTRIYFPATAGEVYEITFDYFVKTTGQITTSSSKLATAAMKPSTSRPHKKAQLRDRVPTIAGY
ncbi:MAG: hypothetical protein Q9205_002561 [Flavoplaca limonia]